MEDFLFLQTELNAFLISAYRESDYRVTQGDGQAYLASRLNQRRGKTKGDRQFVKAT